MKKKRVLKSYHQFIDDIVTYLKSYFYLHAWYISVLYMKEGKIDDESEKIASMGSYEQYMDATLSLYPLANKMWKDGRYKKLTECIVHEFCHTITDPLYRIACKGVSQREGENLELVRELSTQKISVIALHGLSSTDSRLSPYKTPKRKG